MSFCLKASQGENFLANVARGIDAPHPNVFLRSVLQNAIAERIAQDAFVQAPSHPVLSAAPFPSVHTAQVISNGNGQYSINKDGLSQNRCDGILPDFEISKPIQANLDVSVALIGYPSFLHLPLFVYSAQDHGVS